MAEHQQTARKLLTAALAGRTVLRTREGQFLGGIAFDSNPLTEKQANWLTILVQRYGQEASNGQHL